MPRLAIHAPGKRLELGEYLVGAKPYSPQRPISIAKAFGDGLAEAGIRPRIKKVLHEFFPSAALPKQRGRIVR